MGRAFESRYGICFFQCLYFRNVALRTDPKPTDGLSFHLMKKTLALTYSTCQKTGAELAKFY